MGEDFDYAEEFATLDLEALRADLVELMTTSQDWWPADYGHYGPLFIRMSWHAAGTYRIADGRGGGGQGAQRFAPLNSWPDNASLDKARRLLWPIKQKYGRKISWADLLVFTGNVAMESMGFETFGFGFGREDIWEPEEIFWGSEDTWLGDERYSGERELAKPLGAVQMGLIYVNPEGPERQPRPAGRRRRHPRDVRPHGDERRRDGRADRRRPHLRQDPRRGPTRRTSAPSRRARRSSSRASAGRTACGQRQRRATRSPAASRAPGRTTPTKWDNGFLDEPLRVRVGADGEPGRARSSGRRRTRRPRTPCRTPTTRPSAHAPMMLTTDLALRLDPIYEPIARRFYENPDELADAFAKAWYKLLHRDMGPVSRYLGPWVPEPQLWQDPVPAVDHELIDDADVAALKEKILASGLSISRLVATAWAAAASFRGTDKRGGANGARHPARAAEGLGVQRAGRARQGARRRSSRSSRSSTTSQSGGKRVSLADVIVLGGCAAVEQAARNAGHDVTVPFAPGAPTPRRSRPTSSPSPCSSRPSTRSATTAAGASRCRWSTGSSSGRSCCG